MIPTATTGGNNSQFLPSPLNTSAAPSMSSMFNNPAAAFYPPTTVQSPHYFQNNNNQQQIGTCSSIYPQQQPNLIDHQSLLLHQQQQQQQFLHPFRCNQPHVAGSIIGTGNIINSPSGGGVLLQQQQQREQMMMARMGGGLFGGGSSVGTGGGFGGFPPVTAPPTMVVWTPPIAFDSLRNNNSMTTPSIAAPQPLHHHHQYMMTVNNGISNGSHITATPISSSSLFSSSVGPQGEEDSGLGPESSLFESISDSESSDEEDKENIGRRPGKVINKKGKKSDASSDESKKKQKTTTVKALPAEWLRNDGPVAVQNLLRLVRETANSPLIDFVCELLANPGRFGNVCCWVPDRFGAGRGRERRASRWEWAIGDQKAFTGLMNARHSTKQPPKSYMQLNRALKVYEMNKRDGATGVPGTLPGRLLRKMPDRKNHFQFFPDHHQK